jgi:predicted nucleotide-binding protein
MARNIKKEIELQIEPSMAPSRAIELIRNQQEKGKAILSSRPVTHDSLRNWSHMTCEILTKAFGRPSDNINKFEWSGQGSYLMDESEAYYESLRAKEMQSKISFLDTCIELLQLEITENITPVSIKDVLGSPKTKDIFLVHGHDNEVKESVARFLSKLSLNPIILHERPDKGRTIIEKFEEEHQSASAAVILMTADDVGASKENTGDLKSRARQNVILELGFFLGRLGRNNVCVLFDPKVEKPSDYEGVLFISLSDDTWKLKLVRELKAAGLDVDANLAL